MSYRRDVWPEVRPLVSAAVGCGLLAGVMGFPLSFCRPLIAQSETTREFRPLRLLTPRPPITEPETLAAVDVHDQVSDNELVLGVVVGGRARAYPINMLTGPSREIINDTLGDVPIAATWCHLCHNTVVYDRRADDRTLTFAVSGMLWQRNLVMLDSETESLWSHFLGRAMSGPMKDHRLKKIPSELTTWGKWRREHPETTVLSMSRRSKQFVRDFYRRPDGFVYGVVVAGRAYHATYAVLQEHPVWNLRLSDRNLLLTFDAESTATQAFDRTLGETTLKFSPATDGRMIDEQTGTVWECSSGIAVEGPMKGQSLTQRVGMPAFREAWMKFHPESRPLPLGQGTTSP